MRRFNNHNEYILEVVKRSEPFVIAAQKRISTLDGLVGLMRETGARSGSEAVTAYAIRRVNAQLVADGYDLRELSLQS